MAAITSRVLSAAVVIVLVIVSAPVAAYAASPDPTPTPPTAGSGLVGDLAITAGPCTSGLAAAAGYGTIERLTESIGPLSASGVVEWRASWAAARGGPTRDARIEDLLAAPTDTSYFICTFSGTGFVAPRLPGAPPYDGIRLIVPLDGEPILDAFLSEDGPSTSAANSLFEGLWRPLDPTDIPFRYHCSAEELPFTTAELSSAAPAEEMPGPIAEALAHWGGRLLDQPTDWYVVKQSRDRVLVLSGDQGGSFPVDELELTRTITDGPGDEAWGFEGGGDCRPQVILPRGRGGRWRLDPRHPAPGPKTRKLHVIGSAGCNGTEKAGRARIHMTDQAALIVIPMRSIVHSDACHGLGPTRMTVTLPRQLGDRALYDAGSLPLRRIRARWEGE